MTRRKGTPPALIRASNGGSLQLPAPGAVTGDTERRLIEGLVVPFGVAGETSGGRLRFSAGRLSVSAPRRIKLLTEHDQHRPVAVGQSFDEVDAAEADRRLAALGAEPQGLGGLWGTFSVPAGEAGDQAIADARAGLRDAFSVGVQLDDATTTRLRRANGSAVDAAGQLREVSLVSVPAFDDARLAAAAGVDLVVSHWTTANGAAGAVDTPPERHTMTEAQRRRLDALRAQDNLTQDEAAELVQLSSLDRGAAAPADQVEPAAPAAVPATASTSLTVAGSSPAVVPAVAGAARVTSEPAVYTFSADGPSIVRDLFYSRQDADAADRVARFNAQLRDQAPRALSAFTTAAAGDVAVRNDVDGAGTDLPSMFQPNPNRPDMMRGLVDVRRPFISRLTRVPISNAQPFAIPRVGEFTGVGPHTEGTPHRPAGTLTLSGDTVQPTATSGAWEVSRELVDAMNPAIDRIAARAMLRDYQRQTEGKIVSLLAARAAQDGANVYGVSTPLALRGALMDFVNDDEEPGDIVALSRGLLRTLGLDTDTTDRPQLPFLQPVNALGSVRPGYTGLSVDGVELFRAARLDAGLGADAGVIARAEGILWCESNVLQFRFDEVLGPGVIKLALWAYNGAALLDTADVAIIHSGADPTP